MEVRKAVNKFTVVNQFKVELLEGDDNKYYYRVTAWVKGKGGKGRIIPVDYGLHWSDFE